MNRIKPTPQLKKVSAGQFSDGDGTEIATDFAYAFRVEADGSLVREWITEAFTDITGFTPEEFDVLGWEKLPAPEDNDAVTARLKAITTGQPHVIEYRVLTKSGRERWLRDHIWPIWDDQDKQVILVYGAAQDITGQKEAEAQLRIQAHRQVVVAELSQLALRNNITISTLMTEIVEAVAKTLDVEFCAVFEHVVDDHQLRLQAGIGWPEKLIGRATVGIERESQIGYALYVDEPVVVEDLGQEESRFKSSFLFEDQAITSGVNVVIPGVKQPFGVLATHTAKKITFTRDDINFLQSVANILAAAIERKQAEEAVEKSHTLLNAIIEGTSDAVFVKDLEGHYLAINSAGAANFGLTVENFIGKKDTTVLPADLIQTVRQDDRLVVESGQPQTFENIIVRDGDVRIYHSLKAPYRDPEGTIIGVIGVSRDITDLRQAEHAQRVLAEAGKLLSSSLDYSTRLKNVAKAAVPQLSDWCAVHIVEANYTVRQLAVAYADPAMAEQLPALERRFPLVWDEPGGVPNVLRTGQPEFYPAIDAEMLEAGGGQKSQLLQLLYELEMSSAMVLPLAARGRIVGTMTFAWVKSDTHYNASDISLAEELAQRAAMALDNAYLYQAEQEARRETERAAERTASLQTITAALSEALTSVQVAEVIFEQGLKILEASGGAMALLDESGEHLETLQMAGYPAENVENWRRFPVTASMPLAESVRTKKPIFIKSAEELETQYPVLAEHWVAQHNSFAAVPLVVEDRVLGSIAFSFDEPQAFSQADQNFIQALAQQCVQALERARLYEVERQARLEAEASQQRNILLAEARERNRLARELHDNIAQILGFVNLKVATISNLLSEESQLQVKDELDELKQAIGEAYTDVREEIFNLRSKVSSGYNFMEMLQRYIDKYKQFYHLDVQLTIQMDEKTLTAFPSEVSLQVIRFIQEALINVRKHAGVNEAFLHFSQDGEQLCIRVEDEGNGFNVKTVLNQENPSFGMQIMHERVKAAGGKLTIDSSPAKGTRLVVYIPLVFKQERSGFNKTSGRLER